jgi:hypothetical protein
MRIILSEGQVNVFNLAKNGPLDEFHTKGSKRSGASPEIPELLGHFSRKADPDRKQKSADISFANEGARAGKEAKLADEKKSGLEDIHANSRHFPGICIIDRSELTRLRELGTAPASTLTPVTLPPGRAGA